MARVMTFGKYCADLEKILINDEENDTSLIFVRYMII